MRCYLFALLFFAACTAPAPQPIPPILQLRDSLTDPRDGQRYATIETDSLVWMTENLRYGSIFSDTIAGASLQEGRFYLWEDACLACPEGWRLPSLVEWNKFVRQLNLIAFDTLQSQPYHLRDTVMVNFPLSGMCLDNGRCVGRDNYTFWWTFTPLEINTRPMRVQVISRHAETGFVVGESLKISYKGSVRCVRDKYPPQIASVGSPSPISNAFFVDNRDGKNYAIRQYGDAVWMTDNLAYVTSGSAAPSAVPDSYGLLYSWTSATEACPEGWHLPNEREWLALEYHLTQALDSSAHSVQEKRQMLSLSLRNATEWSVASATPSGFNAVPAGFCQLLLDGSDCAIYAEQQQSACYWIFDQQLVPVPDEKQRHFIRKISDMPPFYSREEAWFRCSVRCVQDAQ